MNKKIEIIIIEDDTYVAHRTISTVSGDSNTYTVAINAIIEALTGTSGRPLAPIKQNSDKFSEAVPNYPSVLEAPPTKIEAQMAFHPDLIKQGVAPVQTQQQNAIPVIKLDMKTILRNAEKK